MRTTQQSQTPNSRSRHVCQGLACLLLFVVSASGGWQSSSQTALGQTSRVRFTESLKFQVEPGIEYGQTTSGNASKDEATGPWLISALRIDLTRARLKVVHALDEGVGLETVSSLAARYGAPVATNGGYFRSPEVFR